MDFGYFIFIFIKIKQNLTLILITRCIAIFHVHRVARICSHVVDFMVRNNPSEFELSAVRWNPNSVYLKHTAIFVFLCLLKLFLNKNMLSTTERI